MTLSPKTLPPLQLGRGWHATSFGCLSITASVTSLIGFVGWSATNVMAHDAAMVTSLQGYYFDSIDDVLVSPVIASGSNASACAATISDSFPQVIGILPAIST